MKVELQIENVVTKTECYKTFDVDALVKYNGAFRDIGFPPAKFRFMRPKKQVTVNVYKTGKIICLGAKSIERAIEYTERIMKKLDITDSSEITVTRVMMSGHFVEKVNVYNAIPLIEKARYNVVVDTEAFQAIFITGRNTSTHIFATVEPIKINCSGPDEETIRSVVDELYGIILRANS